MTEEVRDKVDESDFHCLQTDSRCSFLTKRKRNILRHQAYAAAIDLGESLYAFILDAAKKLGAKLR